LRSEKTRQRRKNRDKKIQEGFKNKKELSKKGDREIRRKKKTYLKGQKGFGGGEGEVARQCSIRRITCTGLVDGGLAKGEGHLSKGGGGYSQNEITKKEKKIASTIKLAQNKKSPQKQGGSREWGGQLKKDTHMLNLWAW